MSDDTYNGWCNRETWATHLHLSNDEDLYDIARRIVREEDAAQQRWRDEHDHHTDAPLGQYAADRMQDWIQTAVEEFLHAETSSRDAWASTEWIRMLLADVGSIWRVDWHAVADAFRYEMEDA